QWIESVFQTLKEQLSLERHRARTLPGVVARVAQRLLALAACLWHNQQIGDPGRHLTAYGH
ncbi:MAG: IS982 family transposase, partial [Nocardioidaceae bacterium]